MSRLYYVVYTYEDGLFVRPSASATFFAQCGERHIRLDIVKPFKCPVAAHRAAARITADYAERYADGTLRTTSEREWLKLRQRVGAVGRWRALHD